MLYNTLLHEVGCTLLPCSVLPPPTYQAATILCTIFVLYLYHAVHCVAYFYHTRTIVALCWCFNQLCNHQVVKVPPPEPPNCQCTITYLHCTTMYHQRQHHQCTIYLSPLNLPIPMVVRVVELVLRGSLWCCVLCLALIWPWWQNGHGGDDGYENFEDSTS